MNILPARRILCASVSSDVGVPAVCRVHPLDQLFKDFPAFASNQEVPAKYRSEVSATWTHKVLAHNGGYCAAVMRHNSLSYRLAIGIPRCGFLYAILSHLIFPFFAAVSRP